LVARACRLIETAQRAPTLKELAAHVNLSPSHFHRVFKKATGITPRAYAAQVRAGLVRANLKKDASVTQALSDAGYASPGRFYDKSAQTLGMRPSQYKQGGAGLTIRFALHTTYLGPTLIAATDKGICLIAFADTDEELLVNLTRTFPQANLVGDDADFERTSAQAVAFIESPGERFPLPMDIQGTAFQRRVWEALTALKPGESATYQQVAQSIGSPKAVRAVANACAANKLAVAVPCHRVKRKDGGLGGYRWGLERKRKLLARESKQ
jgi:AraC family transcriptional regulator of adaptative response/methylated-DNA-[protein]-cysteine methyltransferase